MTKSERAEFRRVMALNELALLERIEYHGRKLVEEGKTPVTPPEWVAYHRRRIEKVLAETQPA